MRFSIGAPCQSVEILGIRTAYFRAGRGPRVVLLHGGAPGACSEVNWCCTFDDLVEAGFDVLAYDQPGFGRTAEPTEHSIEFRYAHLVALLRVFGIERATIVGNSIGGLLAMLLYHRHEHHKILVGRLVLIAPLPHFPLQASTRARYSAYRQRLTSLEPSYESVRELCSNTFADIGRIPDSLVLRRLEMMQGAHWDSVLARRRAGNDFDGDGLAEAKCDALTLVIWGLQDRSIPPEVGLEFMPRLQRGEFVFMQGAGHWPQIELADDVNALLIDFLARDSSGAGEVDGGSLVQGSKG